MKNDKNRETNDQDAKQKRKSSTEEIEDWEKNWTPEKFTLDDGPEEDDY